MVVCDQNMSDSLWSVQFRVQTKKTVVTWMIPSALTYSNISSITDRTTASSRFVAINPNDVVSRSYGNTSVVNDGLPVVLLVAVIMSNKNVCITDEEVPSTGMFLDRDKVPG